MQNIIDSVHTSNKDTYRSDFHHQISVRCLSVKKLHGYSDRCLRFGFSYNFRKQKNKNKNKKARYFFAIVDLILLLVCLSLLQQIVFTTVTKKKKMETVQWKKPSPTLRPLWPTVSRRNVSRTFVELCMQTPYQFILLYRFGATIWPPEINKNIWSSFFL